MRSDCETVLEAHGSCRPKHSFHSLNSSQPKPTLPCSVFIYFFTCPCKNSLNIRHNLQPIEVSLCNYSRLNYIFVTDTWLFSKEMPIKLLPIKLLMAKILCGSGSPAFTVSPTQTKKTLLLQYFPTLPLLVTKCFPIPTLGLQEKKS
jgi:hypothetical protein